MRENDRVKEDLTKFCHELLAELNKYTEKGKEVYYYESINDPNTATYNFVLNNFKFVLLINWQGDYWPWVSDLREKYNAKNKEIHDKRLSEISLIILFPRYTHWVDSERHSHSEVKPEQIQEWISQIIDPVQNYAFTQETIQKTFPLPSSEFFNIKQLASKKEEIKRYIINKIKESKVLGQESTTPVIINFFFDLQKILNLLLETLNRNVRFGNIFKVKTNEFLEKGKKSTFVIITEDESMTIEIKSKINIPSTGKLFKTKPYMLEVMFLQRTPNNKYRTLLSDKIAIKEEIYDQKEFRNVRDKIINSLLGALLKLNKKD